MNQWLIYGFYTHVNVICKALACQNVCSFFLLFVRTFFWLRPSMATKETKNPLKKRGGHKPVSRGTTATAWFQRHGTMGSTAAWVVFKLRWNGTQRRAQEVGNGGWMDWCLWLCWQTKMIQIQKQTYYIGEMFFFISGDGRERNTIRKYSTSWVWLFQKKQSL